MMMSTRVVLSSVILYPNPPGPGGRGTRTEVQGRITMTGNTEQAQVQLDRVELHEEQRRVQRSREYRSVEEDEGSEGVVTMIMMRLCSFHLCEYLIPTLRGRGRGASTQVLLSFMPLAFYCSSPH